MTLVYGQIESLKKIRETLDEKGITRFNSIGDIKKFIANYDNEIEGLFFKIEHDFDLELDILQAKGFELQKGYNALKTNATTRLNNKISSIKTKCRVLSNPAKNALMEVINWYQLQLFKGTKFILEKSFDNIVHFQTFKKKYLKSTMKKINTYMTNRQSIISKHCEQKFKELEKIKSTVSQLDPLIAGAIGENLVEKELKKLSDSFVLFNDFSLKFEKPIYNKRKNDHIFSIQIDHLLVTHGGIFIIETKNWSKKSIARMVIRSPVEQIQRASFALYVILNKSNILNLHHWGDKKLPIRNIVVMINNKPKEKFKFVAIKNLRELNGYINYFKPIFDQSEVNSIIAYLKTLTSQKK